jgi:thioredoxin reductase (NADPH)
MKGTYMEHEVIVIGSGPAGLTAALYLARANLKPLVFAGSQPGGQLMITTEVDNYPGFPEGIQGPELMQKMLDQAKRFGAEISNEDVTRVDFSRKDSDSEPLKLWVGEQEYRTKSVVIATGASALWLGLESETRLRGHGVSACATCDGFFFKGKRVAIVGGGNTAVEEALYMTNHASHVTLIHRRSKLRAEQILQEKLFHHPKITVVWDHVVQEVIGHENPRAVTGIVLHHVETGIPQTLEVDGVFVAIGHDPATKVFQGHLPMDPEGYLIVIPGTTKTSIPGVFAAGDVQDKVYRQAVTAAGQGCMAALEVEKYFQEC